MSINNDFLNKIIDFKTSDGIVVTGYLTKPGSNIWLVGRLRIEDYRTIVDDQSINLIGTLKNRSVWLNNGNISSSSINSVEPEFELEYVNINYLPSEVFIGEKDSEFTQPLFKSISMKLPELSWFFNGRISINFDSSGHLEIPTDVNSIFLQHHVNDDMTISISGETSISRKRSYLGYSVTFNVRIEFAESGTLSSVLKETST